VSSEDTRAAPVRRREDPPLLTGRGRYLDDLSRPGILHAAFARSPHAHARIIGVDGDVVRRMPGVAIVVTARELAGTAAPLVARLDTPDFRPTPWFPLAHERVRFAGEAVAAVCASDVYVAADACESLPIDYEPLPVLSDVDRAAEAGAPQLHDGLERNVLLFRRASRGDVDQRFAEAAVILHETFAHARCSAAPMEPRGVIAEWDDDRLTVWTGTQVPFVVRSALARALAIAESRVRVVVPDTGGGFGQKMHVLPEDVVVAVLARMTGRPVKWVETRHENLTCAPQAREQRVEVELAADWSGALLALRARIVADSGAYHLYPVTAALDPAGTAAILPGPYRCPAYAYEALAIATNKPPLGAYRGVGMTMGVFVMERMMDLLAARLGLDPVEVRRRNLITSDAYPFTSASGVVYDSGDLPAALDRAVALAGYDRIRKEHAEARSHGRRMGVGVACYTEYTGLGSSAYRRRGIIDIPGPEAATVRMDADGSVRCALSFPSQGQGHATIAAEQLAAELGVSIDQVTVLRVDTASAPAGSGTFASRGAIVKTGAVVHAAGVIRRKLLTIAARVLEVSPDDLDLRDSHASVRGVPDRRIGIAEIARLAYAPPAEGLPDGIEPGLEATASFDPAGPTFAGGVHVASVEIDSETGRVRVRDYVVVEDCGRVLHAPIADGQTHGAITQGIGEALGERLVYDREGQNLAASLMEYALPTAADVPSFTVGHLSVPSPLTPGGVKGVGEGGTIAAPAAIANAVADALGPGATAPTALPIIAERLIVGGERAATSIRA
jgi:carbon-monoxide dehydrogenase large subunit